MILPLFSACGTRPPPPPSTLTQGAVQLHLQKNLTRKDEVLKVFGSPNITTRDGDGNEVWTYERHSVRIEHTSSGLLLGIVRSSVGIGFGGSKSSSERGSKNIILIIKFNQKDVVIDFKSRTTSF